MKNSLDYDKEIWTQGISTICGIDEVGRGPLAGPVVAAAVILPAGTSIAGVNDSKQLGADNRMQLKTIIEEIALDFGLGVVSEVEIDRFNIVRATFLAMQRAVDALDTVPEYILVDGNQFPMIVDKISRMPLKGRAVVKGDSLSLSIASASILAKVHRDALMEKYAREYPHYGFEKHKGYGTAEHRNRIKEFGLSPIHRKTFMKSQMIEKIPFPGEER